MSYAMQIRGALYDWIYEELGRPVVFSHANAPRPVDYEADDRGAFAEITLMGGSAVGIRDEATYADQDPADGPDLLETILGHRQLAVSVDLYSGDVDEDMSILLASVSGAERDLAFQAAGIGFARNGEIRNFSDILDSEWEDRRQVDVWFNTFEAFDTGVVTALEDIEITDDNTGAVISITPQGVSIDNG